MNNPNVKSIVCLNYSAIIYEKININNNNLKRNFYGFGYNDKNQLGLGNKNKINISTLLLSNIGIK